MRRRIYLSIVVLLMFTSANGQMEVSKKYYKLIDDAKQLYASGDYLKSGQTYSKAFIAFGGKGFIYDRYDAAGAWALANVPDSAFVQLFKIAENGLYKDLREITSDTVLNSLHQDERWNELIQTITAYKEKEEINFDKPLVALLDSIYEEDQKYRHQISGIEKQYGWESDEMKAHWKIITEKDSLNLIAVTQILDERGWLGPDIIGKQGNQTLFLVIQHADQATQEKYLPMMREAVKNGNAPSRSLALLEDRVALGRGEKQIYGSQVGRDPETGKYYVLPLIDPDNVDQRRKEVGLDTMQEYVSFWGMKWDVEKYKKKLPEYEAIPQQ